MPSRRQVIAGGMGAAGLGMFGLLGACARHIAKDPEIDGRTRGPFGDWSLISPRGALFEASRFDVVIIGSGYGGAVTAARLAAHGASVAVLERGQEWLPGDFPESLDALLGASRAMDPNGLLDLYTPDGSDMDIISASGVGGTSLINAAISTRPEGLVFEQPEWPSAIQQAHADGSLAGYFDRATAVLSPQQYGGPDPMKVAMHRSLAGQRGGGFAYAPVNITFRDEVRGDPRWPVRQHACTLCGNCTTGCNWGAKGTLQANYLPMARVRGARIFAGIEVDRIERRRGGWRVHYLVRHADGASPRTIDADSVIVAAGSLGSTEIMMRSAAAGLKVSPALGSRVSANGDMLGFCYNGDAPTNLVGQARGAVDHSIGTALMGFVDYRGERARGSSLQDRFLLLEGTIPVSVANTVAKALAAWALLDIGALSRAQLGRVMRDLADATTHAPDGALAHSTLYLACGHDDSGGRYVYQAGGRPRIVWKNIGDSRFVESVNAEMAAFTQLRGGRFIRNPRSTLFNGRIMAPHPLGGCPMGEDARRGVVDDAGRVFDAAGGTHRGLYVVDGSIIPRSLAATPLLTICALAERAAERIIAGPA